MDPDSNCQCSMSGLQIMTELRNVQPVVELGTILDLVQRVYTHGQEVLKCKDCRKSPHSSFVMLPALAEHCLSLFEAVCLAYSITRTNALFDPAVLAFEQPLSQFICMRSKTQLGQMELDEKESALLVKTLVGRNLMKILEIMKTLQKIFRSLAKDTGPHRAGPATLRACESSVEATIRRFAAFMEQIEIDSVGVN
ncbi:uncharacterized protein BO80DRAFT_441521 [Aspergillus ibericus CBS 121593]|uniref:Uncharacterized protein n=1 Tax=Aspergillus ibericus CBS 121593 TaxID=1448316 RepID=A0A395HBZ2_9EURO|nr:hypothetical protein BO80DRAFT_441521 [Aspergillus ibericus CBS 121593]RAL04655.1 hypothetical protein BO80DRAFT_441521 [Aspergillus ibericus CBS 121593]